MAYTLTSTLRSFPNDSNAIYTLPMVPADGTVSQVVFSPPFPNGLYAVFLQPANYSGSDNAILAAQIIGLPTPSGFSFMVGGGQAGSVCTLYVLPFGY